MSMKLTKKQKDALSMMYGSVKSGAYWRDLGISPKTIASLKKMGLVNNTLNLHFNPTIINQSWYLTEKGKEIWLTF